MREKDSGNSTIFDDVIRTAQERQDKLFVPMVNETLENITPKIRR